MKIINRVFFFIFFLYSYSANAQFSIQNALLEVHTGAWVQFAPDGAVYLNTVLGNHPSVAIAVNIHNGDAMEILDGIDLYNFYSPAFPQALINRSGTLISRSSWASAINAAIIPAASVTVSFDSVRYNSSSRVMDIYLKALFTGSVTGDMRFNCIVVEDSVSGTGSGYNQVNADNNTPGHPYYQAGNPIINFQHRYVARDYLGGAWGTAGIIANSVNFGSAFWYHYSYVLPANFNENRISLVGLVSLHQGTGVTQRKILNAEKFTSISFPVANFNANTYQACKGEKINYSNTSSTNVIAWNWTFEGGVPSSSNLSNPGPVSYPSGGNFTTKLVVSTATSSASIIKNITIDSANITVAQTNSYLMAQANGATYQWLDCNNNYAPIIGENQQVFILTANGNFAVKITQNNCTDTSACILFNSFAIPETGSNQFLIFPNPTNGVINVSNLNNFSANLIIFDITGRELLSQTIHGKEVQIDLSEFEDAVYIFCITFSNYKYYYKVNKKD